MQIHVCKLLAGRRWGLGVFLASVHLYIPLVCLQLAEGHDALRMAAALLACLYGSL